MKLRTILLLILFAFSIHTFAQDINFMMYSNTSLNINPAMISADDNFKIAANYNNRTYINDVEAQSAYLMLSRPLFKNNNRFGGFGLSVYSDKGGNIQQLINEGLTGAYAHEVQLTSWSRLSLGLQASYRMKRVDTREFTTGNQWTESGYNPDASNGEQFESLSTGSFSLSSGLYWYIPNKDRTTKFFLGVSVFNLTQPQYSFFGAEQTEPYKYIANTGYEVYSNNNFSVMPNILYYNSYNTHNWRVGSRWTYKFNLSKENWYLSSGSIDLITAYQINEGAITGIQVNQKGFSFGIGYGFSDQYTNQYTPDKGTVEISFTFRKSLFKKAKSAKEIILTEEGYYEGQLRDLAFKKEETKEIYIEKEDIENVDEIKDNPERDIKFKLQKDFNFGFNKAELDDEAKSYLEDIVILLSNNKMLKIEITGHTDNVGTKEANQIISEQRAEIVKEYLMDKGIKADRIITKGEADNNPLFENETEENRAKNRRVEFIIYY